MSDRTDRGLIHCEFCDGENGWHFCGNCGDEYKQDAKNDGEECGQHCVDCTPRKMD